MELYPLTFHTIYKDKIWGGQKIRTLLGKDFSPLPNCGETWEISGIKGAESIVKNGIHAGKNLQNLIEEFKERLLGEKMYRKFSTEFPLLIKFIDANDDLSIQVHPNDELAKERHNSFGKTEMWYILQADEGAVLNSGFNKKIDKEEYLKHLEDNTLSSILNFEEVKAGDVFFLPAGRVHYIGKGICLAEIQQTSDITYRIYDFDRKDDKGLKRELHTELALDAIDFNHYEEYKRRYDKNSSETELVNCQYFKTNLLQYASEIQRDYSNLDSFVIYICTEGEGIIHLQQTDLHFTKGDCILIPAELKRVTIKPTIASKIIEVYC